MEKIRAYYTPDIQRPEDRRLVTILALIPSATYGNSSTVIFEEDADGQLDEASILHFKVLQEGG